MDWNQAAPVVLAAFLASLVEFVEALTIVLAAGLTRGWRSALTGAFSGAVVLAAIVALLGPNLRLVPLPKLQLALGLLLLAFGLRWLWKAVLRAAGVKAPHNEEKIFERHKAVLQGFGGADHRFLWSANSIRSIDALGFVTAFKGVFVEGVEVVFIVIATGAAGGLLLPAGAGALFAAIVVAVLGFALHRPLARVPENALKFAVGVLLSSFGVFWIGEGAGFPWPGGDWAIPWLIAVVLVAALCAVRAAKSRSRVPVLR
ncbi:MAG: COG4280 domain-containing protein [Bryobacteraceae bacterium]